MAVGRSSLLSFADVGGRLLSTSRLVLEGQPGATSTINDLAKGPVPEFLVALRLYASDVLIAYQLSGQDPGNSLLQLIVQAIVALPKPPGTAQRIHAIDRATIVLLKRFGVKGLVFRNQGPPNYPSARDLIGLIEWAAACSSLAVPGEKSPERSILMKMRTELLQAVALVLLELEPVLAAAGLRWLALLVRTSAESRLVSAGIHRAFQLGVEDEWTCFNCCLAARFLQRFEQ